MPRFAPPATADWAHRWGASERACELLRSSDFVDAHCDLYIPVRLYGYRPRIRHRVRSRSKLFFGHTDLPRLREAGYTGVVLDVATQPFRRAAGRLEATARNVQRIVDDVAAMGDDFVLAANRDDYARARESDRTAVWLGIQGGHAMSADLGAFLNGWGRHLHRVTLVHLTPSAVGGTSSPIARDRGLTEHGRAFVQACDRANVLVDLAHAGKRTFWDALEAHPGKHPPIVSHTGIAGVHPHWRNLDDRQIDAIAERAGVIGIIFHSHFLGKGMLGCRRSKILDHVEYVIDRVGDAHVALGTDYDGMIVPPRDLPDVCAQPLLVDDMLDRGWSEERVRRILGLNYLRVVPDGS